MPLPKTGTRRCSDAMCPEFRRIKNSGNATYNAEAAIHADVKCPVVVSCTRTRYNEWVGVLEERAHITLLAQVGE